MTRQYLHTWEEAVEILRQDPQHQKLIWDSYLTADLIENCRRFHASDEFNEILQIVQTYRPQASRVLDIPAGNGIASFSFAKSGFEVVSVEPDPSTSVGRGAVEFLIQREGLTNITAVDAYGEHLPFHAEEFDVAYIRQGLHHARELNRMISEVARVLKTDGLLIACREPVVDNYEEGLQEFLDAQPDHQLYGGENALTHQDYLRALGHSQLELLADLGPYDSAVNLHPSSLPELKRQLLNSRSARILKTALPEGVLYRLQLMLWRYRNREQGRLYTFIAKKKR